MNLTQLRHLVAITDASLNMSLAAERLSTTQPALSRQIKQLEEELGFQIFVRRGKSLVTLTASGNALLIRARAVVGEIRNIDAIAANHRSDTRGTLRVATTQTLGRFVLPTALGRLRARFGAVGLRLRPGGEQECLSMLERDEIDLALVSTEGERPNYDVAIPLFTWRRAVVAPHSHPLTHRCAPLDLDELARFPLVAAENAADVNGKIGRIFHANGLAPDIACTARDADTIKTFVRHDLGIGLMAEMALTADDTDLVDLNGGHLFPTCITWAVLRSDRIQRDYVFELLRELAPTLAQQDIDSALQGLRSIDLVAQVGPWRQVEG